MYLFLIHLTYIFIYIIYYFAQRFSKFDINKNNKTDWEKRWNIPYFRHGMKLMTLVWGLGFILEAAIKVILVYTLSISEFLLVSNFVSYGIIALLIFWQVKYVKKFKKIFQKSILIIKIILMISSKRNKIVFYFL